MAIINPNTPPETREVLFDPCFEPTGNNEFRLAALFARQTKADHGWNQETPRRVIVMENLSPHDIAGIIAAGGEALASTARNQYNEITDAAWQRNREQQEATETEADNAEFERARREDEVIDPDGDQSAEDDAAVDGILARIESSACDQ